MPLALKRTIFAFLTTLPLAACSTYSSNMRIGNDMSYASLSDQREASMTVQIYETLPEGARVVSSVDAGRCHRSFVESSPNDNLVIMDLKIAAYVLGANGLVDVEVENKSALTKNCWYAANGRALAIVAPDPEA